jgi:hypothetical protein
MEPSFEKLLVLLAEAGVEFIVVGGIDGAPRIVSFPNLRHV